MDSDEHGVPSRFQLRARDLARSTTFEGPIGWTAETLPRGAPPCTVFPHGGFVMAGLRAVTPGARTRGHVDMTADDAGARADESTRLGALSLHELHDAPGIGRAGGRPSPPGVAFGIDAHAR